MICVVSHVAGMSSVLSFFSGRAHEAFADPKSPGKTLSNEGHGLSRAFCSSTQLENWLPARQHPINSRNLILFAQAWAAWVVLLYCDWYYMVSS